MREPRLSKSQINNYESCPQKWKLDKIDKIPQPPSPILERGKEVHAVLEHFYEGAETVTEAVHNMLDNPLARKHNKEIKNFIEFNKRLSSDGETLLHPVMIEEYLKDKELNISGFVDAVYVNERDETLVLDYKTGKLRPLSHHRFELALYARMVELNKGVVPTHWGIYFVDHDVLKTERVKEDEVYKAMAKVHEVRSKINAKEFPRRPKYPCTWCPYYKTHCPGGGKWEVKK